MITQFTSHQIKGKGRGKFLGYPTINLVPPDNFDLKDGIYAVWVTISGTVFRGAMHWGPIPTFEDDQVKSLEVFLLGLDGQDLTNTDLSRVAIDVKERLRDILKFGSINDLIAQIDKDVLEVRRILTG